MAPVTFYRDSSKPIKPLAVAPWWNEPVLKDQPPCIQALRGDFFCMPFGGADTAYHGRKYPPHGETANRRWSFVDRRTSKKGSALDLGMKLKLQAGEVRKSLALEVDTNIIYSRHRLSGMSGNMTYSHHATLQFPDKPGSARLSFSPFAHAFTYPHTLETPAEGSYAIIKKGCILEDLTKVPLVDGTTTDLTSYPNRRGYEDAAVWDRWLRFGSSETVLGKHTSVIIWPGSPPSLAPAVFALEMN